MVFLECQIVAPVGVLQLRLQNPHPLLQLRRLTKVLSTFPARQFQIENFPFQLLDLDIQLLLTQQLLIDLVLHPIPVVSHVGKVFTGALIPNFIDPTTRLLQIFKHSSLLGLQGVDFLLLLGDELFRLGGIGLPVALHEAIAREQACVFQLPFSDAVFIIVVNVPHLQVI